MRAHHSIAAAVIALTTLFAAADAQQPRRSTAIANMTPDPADVASIDAIITALYDVISGDAGEPRDWDRFRSLFYENARLIAMSRNAEGARAAVTMDPPAWIARAEPAFARAGFHEQEIGRSVETFGDIAHAFSAYQSVRAVGEPPFTRGVNSIQLLRENGRWWIVTVMWDVETPETSIPARLLDAPAAP